MGYTALGRDLFHQRCKGRITTNPKQEVRDYVHTFMYPEEDTMTESTAESDPHSSTSRELKKSSTTAKKKVSATKVVLENKC